LPQPKKKCKIFYHYFWFPSY